MVQRLARQRSGDWQAESWRLGWLWQSSVLCAVGIRSWPGDKGRRLARQRAKRHGGGRWQTVALALSMRQLCWWFSRCAGAARGRHCHAGMLHAACCCTLTLPLFAGVSRIFVLSLAYGALCRSRQQRHLHRGGCLHIAASYGEPTV